MLLAPPWSRFGKTEGSLAKRQPVPAGMADSSATSTDGGQARRLKVVVFCLLQVLILSRR